MSILNILGGEFIEVIEWVEDRPDMMVFRFPTVGRAIKYGAKLTVREGQTAVFVHEGQLADVFGPGLYMLETNNIPVMTRLRHWDHGFRSPFKSEVYFLKTTRFNNLKWGTRNPIIARDPEFGPVRLRAFGTYSMRITEAATFMTEIVGTHGEFTSDEIATQIRNVIVQEFSRAIAAANIPVLDMAANTDQLGSLVSKAIAPVIEGYGLALPEFYIENVSLPADVEAMLDKRTSMGIIGDLDRFSQYAASAAMLNASKNEGGAGAGFGAAMGAAMGMGAAARPGPWGAAPQNPQPAQNQASGSQPQGGPTPPPLPGSAPAIQWHVAVDGQARGPISRDELAGMARAGQMARDSLVWTEGQEGWKPAGEIPDLASIFAAMPPPLPR